MHWTCLSHEHVLCHKRDLATSSGSLALSFGLPIHPYVLSLGPPNPPHPRSLLYAPGRMLGLLLVEDLSRSQQTLDAM